MNSSTVEVKQVNSRFLQPDTLGLQLPNIVIGKLEKTVSEEVVTFADVMKLFKVAGQGLTLKDCRRQYCEMVTEQLKNRYNFV